MTDGRLSIPPTGPSTSFIQLPPGPSLRIPRFAQSLTQPISLSEELGPIFRMPRRTERTGRISPMTSRPPSRAAELEHSAAHLLLLNLPPLFTQQSIEEFAKSTGLSFTPVFPLIRLLSVNDNQKGSFVFSPKSPLLVNSFAIIARGGSTGLLDQQLMAYGQAAWFEIFQDDFSIYTQIHAFLSAPRFWVPSLRSAPATPDSRFGGGLARRSNVSFAKPRFALRGRTVDLGPISENDWKKRGAVAVDFSNQGRITNVRFTRMEIRESVLDSFVVHLELVNFGAKEVGISLVRVGGEDKAVLLENNDVLSDLVPIISTFSQNGASPLIPQPLPSPRPR